MECTKKRTVFNLFNIYDCADCKHRRTDEFAVIGYNVYAVYYICDTCPHVHYEDDYFIATSKKLRLLFKDAIYYDERIMFLFFEEYRPESYLHIFDKIMEAGYDVQIVTIK